MWIAFTAFLGTATADEEPLYLAQVGITLQRPRDWTVPRWSDWDLDGRDSRRTVQVHVYSSTYQVPVDDDATRAWAESLAFPWLEETQGAVNPTVESTAEVLRDGVAHGVSEVRYLYKGEHAAVAWQDSFAVEGRMVHVLTTAIEGNRSKARSALDTWVKAVLVDKPAKDIEELGSEVTAAGFASELPDGWRIPLRSEFLEAVQLASKLGQKRVTDESCWMGIRPRAEGETAMLLACTMEVFLGVVDEHSFAAVDERLRGSLFGGFGEKLDAAELLQAPGARVSALYRLPSGGDTAVWVAATPYNAGLVLTYGLGNTGEDADLRAAVEHAVGGLSFLDPDGGAHPAAAGDVLMYYLMHRKTHPFVWVPLILLGLGFFQLVARARTSPSYEDWD
ncbi:MAG: hypothetical protein VX519_10510 [Myxococcota bacterium]|nr:hypothetical protein [Myxococcota bacterium]